MSLLTYSLTVQAAKPLLSEGLTILFTQLQVQLIQDVLDQSNQP